jgi:hypothetical protein
VLAVLLSACVVFGTAPPAAGQTGPSAATARAQAAAHARRGQDLYAAHRYAEALAEFKASYTLNPWPEMLYAMGQAARGMGDCARAIRYYRAFLGTRPSKRQEDAARVQLDRCEHRLENQPPAATPPPASVSAAKPPPGATEGGGGPTPAAPGATTADPGATAAEPPPGSGTEPGAEAAQVSASASASAGPRRTHAHVGAAAVGDVTSLQGGGEVRAAAALGRWLALGAAAVLGRQVGARATLELHPPREDGRRWSWAVEARLVIHPLDSKIALGGGAWGGATLEAGPGRVRAGAAVEGFSAPSPYRPYAVLGTLGYEFDL